MTDDSTNVVYYAPSEVLEFTDEFPESNFHTYGPDFMYTGLEGGFPSATNFGYMMFISNVNGMFVDGFYPIMVMDGHPLITNQMKY